MMRILETPAYFLPNQGGIESIVYQLGKEWVRQGHHVKILTSNQGSNKNHEIMSGIHIQRVSSFSILSDVFSFPLIPSLLKNLKSKPDIVHIHHPHTFWLYACAVCCMVKKVPYALHMHGRELVLPGWKGMIISVYNTVFLKHALNNAKYIMTHSEKVIKQSKMLKKFQSKIRIIPHGVEKSYTIHTPSNKNNVFTLGIRNYKRLDILINAMKRVQEKIPDARLLIAGKGPQEKQLKALAKSLKVNAKFYGYISEKQKEDLYKYSDVFVLSSPTIMESFGTVATDALAAGCPAIITSSVGAADLFKKEGIGIIVKPFDVDDLAQNIIKVLKNPKMAISIGKKGKNILNQKYLWQQQAKKYISVFNNDEKENIRKHYESENALEMFNLNKASGHLKRKQVKLILSYLKNKKGKLLDIGCGPGIYSIKLAKHFNVTAIDLAKNMVNATKILARKKNVNINAYVKDASKTGFKSELFDYILLIDTVHHMNNKLAKEVYTECYRILKPQGTLITDYKNKHHPLLNIAYKRRSTAEFPLYARTMPEMKKLLNAYTIKQLKSGLLNPYKTIIAVK